jgi:hypothetical protein
LSQLNGLLCPRELLVNAFFCALNVRVGHRGIYLFRLGFRGLRGFLGLRNLALHLLLNPREFFLLRRRRQRGRGSRSLRRLLTARGRRTRT